MLRFGDDEIGDRCDLAEGAHVFLQILTGIPDHNDLGTLSTGERSHP